MLKLHFIPQKKVLETAVLSPIPMVRGRGGVHALGVRVAVYAATPGQWWRDDARMLATYIGRQAGAAFDANGVVGVVCHPAQAAIVHDILLAAARLHGPHPGVPLTPDYHDLLHTMGNMDPHEWWVVVNHFLDITPQKGENGYVWTIGGATAVWWYRYLGGERHDTLVTMAWRNRRMEALVRAPWELEPASGWVTAPSPNLGAVADLAAVALLMEEADA